MNLVFDNFEETKLRLNIFFLFYPSFFILILIFNFFAKIILNNLFKKIIKLNGDWGLGIGDWGLGMGPNPQSPIPDPPSPIPQPPKNNLNFK